jgi:hypothetical protein
MADPERPDDERYFDLPKLAAYSGLSVATLRRYLADPNNPLPHHHVRQAGKARGRLLVSKREFDAWVRGFTPQDDPTDVSWIRRRFGK